MADSKPVMPLQLTDQDVLLKRVASNFEKHGDTPVPVLDITWEAMVPPLLLVGLLGEYCDRVLFNAKGEVLEPTEIFKRSTLPIPIAEELVAQYVRFVLSDGIEREFGEEPEEGEDAQPSQLCPIKDLAYEPKYGGGVWLGGRVRIRPGDALEHWAFLEHQGRHAKLTIADSSIKVGNGKQRELPLPPPPQAGEGFAAGAAARASTPSEHSAPAKQPADDESAMPVSPGEGEGGPEDEQSAVTAPPSAAVDDAPTPPGYDEGRTITTADGATTQLRSAREIDDEMIAKAAAKSGAHPLDEIGPKTREEIDKAVKRRGPRPIDGRSH